MSGTKAILVGIDGYTFQPLSSAVLDVRAFQAALLGANKGLPPICDTNDITILAAPALGAASLPGALAPTRDAILDALEPYYNATATCDRLIFYFAGHGMSVAVDGRTRESLIVPIDVVAPEDGRNMISVPRLTALFEERGPLEQIWIIDACRDMPYQKRPRGFEIEWNEQVAQLQRAQAVLYAVAPGGTAKSIAGGKGRFTGYLLDGLAGAGSATEHVPGRGHCVTVPSLFNFAKRRVCEQLEGVDDWTLAIQAPQFSLNGPVLEPLRSVPSPPPVDFEVIIEPSDAQRAVALVLEVEQGLAVPNWPPRAPQRILELRAMLKDPGDLRWEQPIPILQAVDLRESSSATVRVPPRIPAETAPEANTSADGTAPAVSLTEGDPRLAFTNLRSKGNPPAGRARLELEAHDQATRVELRRAADPWTRIEDRAGKYELEPGPWDIRFKLGEEVVSSARVVLAEGEVRVVRNAVQLTPALSALLRSNMVFEATGGTAAVPSESIGPMQGAILPTVLPVFALKPFDAGLHSHLLSQYRDIEIPPFNAGLGCLSFGLAVDGRREYPAADLAAVQLEDEAYRVIVAPGRIAIAAGTNRRADGTVSIDLKDDFELNVAVPSLENAVTAGGVVLWPDGRFDVTLGLYRVPIGLDWLDRPISYQNSPGQIARAIAIGARNLMAERIDSDWTWGLVESIVGRGLNDPVLIAVACHALARQFEWTRPTENRRLKQAYDELLNRLWALAPNLPDTRILATLAWGVDHPDARRLLSSEESQQPLLTTSLALLARAAKEDQLENHWATDRLEQIPVGQAFNAIRRWKGHS